MLKENYIFLDVNAKTKEQMLKFIADKAIEEGFQIEKEESNELLKSKNNMKEDTLC